MKADPENPKLALNVDMIAPEGYGEVIGGGQREDDLDILLHKIQEHQLPQEAFEWYLDLRKYGTFVHSGFGLGIERTVSWICGPPPRPRNHSFPPSDGPVKTLRSPTSLGINGPRLEGLRFWEQTPERINYEQQEHPRPFTTCFSRKLFFTNFSVFAWVK